MNANELADKLAKEWILHDKNVGFLMQTSAKFLYTQITMLRQQQAEIEALKAENKFFKDLMGDVEILRKAQEND